METLIQEQMRESLASAISMIEDTDNHYALFGSTLEMCGIAKERNRYLFQLDCISDEEYRDNIRRIEEAKKKMIVTHGKWVAQLLGKSKTEHTVQTLVSSIYHDIFGIEIKG